MARVPSNSGRPNKPNPAVGKISRASNQSEHPHASGLVPGSEILLEVAKRVTEVAKVPVVGGIAALLHGCGRTTRDIDVYTDDFWATHQKLESAGFLWNSERREHTAQGIPIHMVGADQLGGVPNKQSTIKGVRVISLADLVRAKLTSGLESPRRAKDIADVLELIRVVPLKKDFAAKLPTRLRGTFKRFVDEVHGPRRTTFPTLQLWTRTA